MGCSFSEIGIVDMFFLNVRSLEDIFVPLLQKSISIARLKKLHSQILKFSLSQSNFLITKMVDICDRNGNIDYATLLFKQVLFPNSFLYNAMIRVYTHNTSYLHSINVYKQMLREHVFPVQVTYPFVIRSCAGVFNIELGRQTHGHVHKYGFDSNAIVKNSLLDMYVKCEFLMDAHNLFDEMTDRDVVAWNSLITGHMKLRQVRKAMSIFEAMPDKTIVSWTVMISGYIGIGCQSDALDVFRRMQKAGVKPDWISLVTVLPACAKLGALEVGKWIHFYAERNNLMINTCICNALIEMYAKCGSLNQARQVFDQMPHRDVISWSTMISALANHGGGHEVIELFEDMKKTHVEPNEITFVGLLSACVHAGLLNEGLSYFESMRSKYRIEPRIEHYGCLVDLLGRTGCLDGALNVVKKMPMKPDSAIWGSLLSSCRTHGNLEIAVIAMEQLLELEPEDTGNYVLLSNIYAKLRKWEGVSRMRKLIRSQGMKRRTPGCSLIEINDVVQEFLSGDDSKPFSVHIYEILDLLAIHQTVNED